MRAYTEDRIPASAPPPWWTVQAAVTRLRPFYTVGADGRLCWDRAACATHWDTIAADLAVVHAAEPAQDLHDRTIRPAPRCWGAPADPDPRTLSVAEWRALLAARVPVVVARWTAEALAGTAVAPTEPKPRPTKRASFTTDAEARAWLAANQLLDWLIPPGPAVASVADQAVAIRKMLKL